ncbi:hypothetical protein [Cruoricaptor ignavus]|uniref:hypothetical protein n=1 Tax=Cruoricaptor ignavus TaxID=1118202 RepID=UPI0013562EC5|nr:hypothetical protein [Cruoricaptor ignavus]
MKKTILLFTALLFGGGLAIAQLTINPIDEAPCNARNCPGSGTNCCYDGDNNSVFYKGK